MKSLLLTCVFLVLAPQMRAENAKPTELTTEQSLELARAALKMSALENRARNIKEQFVVAQAELQAAADAYEAAVKKAAAEHAAAGCALDMAQKWTGCPEKK